MRIKSIAEHEAAGPVKMEYDRLLEKFGMVPNVTRVFSIWPEVFELHNELYQRVMVDRTLLPKPIKQLIALRVARAASCTYSSFWQTRFLSLLGVNQEIIDAVSGELREAPVDARTMSLLEFADHIARNSATVTSTEISHLRACGFSDEEILEATVIVGYFAFLTSILNALGVEIERPQGQNTAHAEHEP